MVIRDLTLRSAASFGSFHLIRLLYDEYMFYLVEHQVAAATGETPIAVMGEVRQVYSNNEAVSAIPCFFQTNYLVKASEFFCFLPSSIETNGYDAPGTL